MKIIISAIALTLLMVGSSQAMTVSGYPQGQKWIDQSYVPLPDIHLDVLLTDRPCGWDWAAGCYKDWESKIEMKIGLTYPRKTFSHEVGHSFDHRLMSDQDRDWFRGLFAADDPDMPWRVKGSYEGLKETFADLFYLCMRRPIDRKGRWKRREHRVDFSRRVAYWGCLKIKEIAGVTMPEHVKVGSGRNR